MNVPGTYIAIYRNGVFERWEHKPHDDPNDRGVAIINCPYIPIYLQKPDPFILDEITE